MRVGVEVKRTVVVASSVAGGPVVDLVATLGSVPDWGARLVTAMPSERWARGRAAGRVASLWTRAWGFLFPLRFLRPGALRGADVVVATTNPFWLPTLLAVISRRRPVVALVYDVYPDALTVRWRTPRFLAWVIDRLVGAGLRRAAVTVFLGERVRATLAARHGLVGPTAVIPPGIDPDRLRFASTAIGSGDAAGPVTETDSESTVVVSYIGNAGTVHDVETFGGALRHVAERHPGRVRLIIAARGDRAAQLVGAVRGVPNVEVLPYLDDALWASVTTRTDVAVVSLDARAGEVSVPSKVHAALAAGSALFVVAPGGSDLAELVEGSGAGIVVEPGDVESATAALDRLVVDARFRAECRMAARRAFDALTPERLALRWAEVLAVASSPGRPRAAIRRSR